MAATRVSVAIRRPVNEVFAYMNDVAREREWQPQLREAEQLPPGPTAVGSRRRYVSDFMGRRVENTYVIRTYEPESRLVLETTGESVLKAKSEILWEAVPEGTRVTMALEGSPTGALRLIPRRLLEATFESQLKDTLSRLKERLEATG